VISVIIATCNRIDLLTNCISRLLGPGKADFEIIVTDDSNDDSAKGIVCAMDAQITWTRGPRTGPAANRNHGATFAKYNWLLFLDDDCLPSFTLMEAYRNAISTYQEITVFEGCIRADRKQKSHIEEAPVNENGGFLWSCNFLIRKEVFFGQLNGFDDRFPYAAMEDVDFYYRVKKQGIKTMFIQEAMVIHPWRLQTDLYAVTIKRFGSTLYFLQKHPEKRSEINARYYLGAFLRSFLGSTLRHSLVFRIHGILPKLQYDFLQLYFAWVMLRMKKG
jgi:GT2 family glycosyltransferase